MKLKLPEAMSLAFAEAEAAGLRGEVPVGAVVIAKSGEILARAGNRTLELKDPTAHAEVWPSAPPLPPWLRAPDSCDLYVTSTLRRVRRRFPSLACRLLFCRR
jgi:cytidine deaminase